MEISMQRQENLTPLHQMTKLDKGMISNATGVVDRTLSETAPGQEENVSIVERRVTLQLYVVLVKGHSVKHLKHRVTDFNKEDNLS